MATHRVGVVLFEGFEVLDVFGPVEVFALANNHFEITMLGPSVGPVRSGQGVEVHADTAYSANPQCDIALVPGGMGTRTLVTNEAVTTWLRQWASAVPIVTSVCTGSGLLAAAGLLDGYRATSNKRAFAWARDQGPNTTWVAQARWVEDRDRWTSSGVAAGIDMALALIAHLHGVDVAEVAADRAEVEWHRDSTWDPFAAKNGLA